MHDVTADIMAYEDGQMDEDQIIAFFQRLVDSGLAWQLQGSYGRMAQRLIEGGMVIPNGKLNASRKGGK